MDTELIDAIVGLADGLMIQTKPRAKTVFRLEFDGEAWTAFVEKLACKDDEHRLASPFVDAKGATAAEALLALHKELVAINEHQHRSAAARIARWKDAAKRLFGIDPKTKSS